jgi:hypothetical protein
MRSKAFAAAAALSLSCLASPASAEEPSAIGYPSVAAALEALRADPMAVESSQDGWTLFSRAGDLELWSFTPVDHPAHPSAAKRTAYQDGNGAWHVVTRLLCGSTKTACDKLMTEYEQLDAQLKVHIQRKHGSGT